MGVASLANIWWAAVISVYNKLTFSKPWIAWLSSS